MEVIGEIGSGNCGFWDSGRTGDDELNFKQESWAQQNGSTWGLMKGTASRGLRNYRSSEPWQSNFKLSFQQANSFMSFANPR